MNLQQDAFSPLMRPVCVRLTSRMLLPAALLFQLPGSAIEQSVALLQTQRARWIPEAGARSTPPTYSDYREGGGMHVPRGYIESNEMAGRTIYHVERVEVGVELVPDTSTLQPSPESDRGK
jgi:hypothetical protein